MLGEQDIHPDEIHQVIISGLIERVETRRIFSRGVNHFLYKDDSERP